MHVDTAIEGDSRTVQEAEFDLDSRREADTISRQVFVNIDLTVKFHSSWIEIHANPVRNWDLFPFSTTALPPLAPLAAPYLLLFVISEEKRLKKGRMAGSSQEEEDKRLQKL